MVWDEEGKGIRWHGMGEEWERVRMREGGLESGEVEVNGAWGLNGGDRR